MQGKLLKQSDCHNAGMNTVHRMDCCSPVDSMSYDVKHECLSLKSRQRQHYSSIKRFFLLLLLRTVDVCPLCFMVPVPVPVLVFVLSKRFAETFHQKTDLFQIKVNRSKLRTMVLRLLSGIN